MQHLDADATRARLPMAPLIGALRTMFSTGCEVPQRHTHVLGDAGTVLLMPAWRPGAFFGLKTIGIFPGNAVQGLPALHAVYTLFDARSGVPLAQIDGNQITARRTVAASALAADFLARADARRLLIVGAGRVAGLVAEAMRCVRPALDDIAVWNRHAAAAQALAADIGGRAVTDLQAAVRAADIVSCATLATAPLVRGAWLRPGTHLDLVGSFTPAMCEADADAVRRARVFVDTDEALVKAGELLQAAFDVGALQGTLAQLCRGERPGRHSDSEITLFKSVGTALEDLAAAELVWAGEPH
jgi:ornithine cyclodeaminase